MDMKQHAKSNKKQLHIITVGNSIITNYQRWTNEFRIKNAKINETIWSELIKDSAFLNSIFDFLKENPRERSAEINSYEGYRSMKGIDSRGCLVYLCGTKTAINEIAVRTLENYFKERDIELLTPKEVSGYFWEKEIDEKIAVNEFQKGVTGLLDTLLRIATKKKEEGYEVVFNPTGGMKPHVIASALAGFITGSEVYYIHEEFEKKDIVLLPPLLYLPRGSEIDVLMKLKETNFLSGNDYEKLKNKFKEEIERLKIYGLVEVEVDEKIGKEYRIRLTDRGKFIAKLYDDV